MSAPRRPGRRGEQPVVPAAELTSYYGLPVINRPVWRSPEIPGYLFLGGLAAGSSLLAFGAQLTDRPDLARSTKLTAAAAIAASGIALVRDLGRPARFVNMLRVFKPTSPMSIGSWLLAAYGPASGLAAFSAATRRAPRTGATATAFAALLAPAVASYTAALLSDTAVPAWHEAHGELPFVFVGSAAAAAGGATLTTTVMSQTSPARRLAGAGWLVESIATEAMRRRLGPLAEPYEQGVAARWLTASRALGLVGTACMLAGRHHRSVTLVAGVALVGSSVATRFAVFNAGLASADDPKYTVGPQRRRLRERLATGSPLGRRPGG